MTGDDITATVGTVLVTGGASGLGAAVAQAVDEAGGTPVVLDRRQPPFEVEHELVDLADRRAAEAAVERIGERHGALTGVVTAAGTDVPGPLAEVPVGEWERVVLVNLLGTAAVVRAALPYLERAGGRVVTLASTLALRAVAEGTAYCSSKFVVIGFTCALAAETAGLVGVTLLVPGGMDTGFFDGREERFRPSPGTRLNRPEDVAEAVLFALRQPPGCEVRELLVAPSTESSWP